MVVKFMLCKTLQHWSLIVMWKDNMGKTASQLLLATYQQREMLPSRFVPYLKKTKISLYKIYIIEICNGHWHRNIY